VGTRSRRLFASHAEVSHRCCSQPLQQVVADFSADVAFGQVAGKLREHYGVALAPETIRGIVEGHAQAMFEQQTFEEDWPRAAGESLVVAQMDGGMVPIVVADFAQVDRRKAKRLEWKEAKLTLAHALGKTALHYGATLQGGVEEAGRWLLECAHRAGLGIIPWCMLWAMARTGSAIKSSNILANRAGSGSISTMSVIILPPPRSVRQRRRRGCASNSSS
jgi:hypothetical protein